MRIIQINNINFLIMKFKIKSFLKNNKYETKNN